MIEIWKPVPEFEDFYEISSSGRIKSLARTIIRKDGKPLRIKEKMLKTPANGRGYPRVTLYKPGNNSWNTVHSLVAKTFLPHPEMDIGGGKNQFGVNHKDGDKMNNHVDNLEYITNANNVIHARKSGLLCARGSKNGRAKISENDVDSIKYLYSEGATQQELAQKFGICQTSISRVICGTTWKHHATPKSSHPSG